eukprot:15364419-Ditylum_brightwellii.AAC.2
MYGLPQAGRIAHDLLVKNLAPPMDDADHLITSIKEKYCATVDWKGTQYCGIALEWNYPERWLDILVPGYVSKGLKKLKHPKPSKPEHSLHRHVKIKYGREGQLVPAADTLPKVPKETMEYIQAAVGIFLWYGRIVDLTLLPALNAISAQQAALTEETVKTLDHFLNYMATYPNAIVRFHASNTILHIHSDAAYMALPEARSCTGGYFYLSSHPDKMKTIPLNGDIHNKCSTI